MAGLQQRWSILRADCRRFGSSYKLTSSDVGATLRVQVTATNAGGSTAATSALTGLVEAAPPPAPVNLTLPAVEGLAVDGQTLEASTGTWTENPSSYAYQWQDCNSLGASCTSILRCDELQLRRWPGRMPGTRSGSGVKASQRGRLELGHLGLRRASCSCWRRSTSILPALSGSAVEGQSLKASNGTWSGSPTSFTYQWQDCDSSGSSCSVISGASSLSYTLTGSDAGHTVRVQVTATNTGGSESATSSQTAVVQILGPRNTVLPSISGSVVEGQALKASNGTWSGSPTSFSYQWQDCNSLGASCVAISGAVSATYTLAGSDAGHGQGPGDCHEQRRLERGDLGSDGCGAGVGACQQRPSVAQWLGR